MSVEARYGDDIIDILLDFQGRGMTYYDVAQETGFHVTTVRRCAYRYAVKLHFNQTAHFKRIHPVKNEKPFIERFYMKQINLTNCLSQRWTFT
jgi:hypothetical protein